jgi:type I restriction enzyme R subunit
VLDFVNETTDIYKAFKPYYNVTTLDKPADTQLLEELKHELNGMQLYHWSEVESFCRLFYLPHHKQKPSDHARMEKAVAPAVDRFNAADEEQKEKFHEKLSAYIGFYAFASQIIHYGDRELEMLYGYGRYLIRHLRLSDAIATPHPEREVELEYYRLEKVMSGSITLEGGDDYGVKAPTAVGTGKSQDEEKPLSEIIQTINERFATDFNEEDRLFFEQIKEKAANNEQIIQTALANPLDKFELGIKAMIESLMMQRMAENDKIVTRYMDDISFQQAILPILAKEIYKTVLDTAE